MKMRGTNFLRPKISNTHPKDLIKNFKLFKGDLVQVVCESCMIFIIVAGKRDVGKQGKIIDIIKDKNLVVVSDIYKATKHMKPNPFYPQGKKLLKETPIHYSKIQLVDPNSNKPVRVELKYTPEQGLHRFAASTGSCIPLPPKESKYANRKEGPLDTAAELVAEVTWRPDITKSPFPNPLMNELERMRRKNMESYAI
ncbi:translation protein SH3-like domain-containing protein [Globomyces pollinis-pini]|nr:translation protein SH3-like domain-containing protein [Globomyces pollinis-pini]